MWRELSKLLPVLILTACSGNVDSYPMPPADTGAETVEMSFTPGCIKTSSMGVYKPYVGVQIHNISPYANSFIRAMVFYRILGQDDFKDRLIDSSLLVDSNESVLGGVYTQTDPLRAGQKIRVSLEMDMQQNVNNPPTNPVLIKSSETTVVDICEHFNY